MNEIITRILEAYHALPPMWQAMFFCATVLSILSVIVGIVTKHFKFLVILGIVYFLFASCATQQVPDKTSTESPAPTTSSYFTY